MESLSLCWVSLESRVPDSPRRYLFLHPSERERKHQTDTESNLDSVLCVCARDGENGVEIENQSSWSNDSLWKSKAKPYSFITSPTSRWRNCQESKDIIRFANETKNRRPFLYISLKERERKGISRSSGPNEFFAPDFSSRQLSEQLNAAGRTYGYNDCLLCVCVWYENRRTLTFPLLPSSPLR